MVRLEKKTSKSRATKSPHGDHKKKHYTKMKSTRSLRGGNEKLISEINEFIEKFDKNREVDKIHNSLIASALDNLPSTRKTPLGKRSRSGKNKVSNYRYRNVVHVNNSNNNIASTSTKRTNRNIIYVNNSNNNRASTSTKRTNRNIIYVNNSNNNRASTSTKRTKVVNNSVLNNTMNRALTTTAHQNYIKIDSPPNGLCSLYSLYGLFGMPLNNKKTKKIIAENVQFLKKATSQSGFTRNVERGLNKLFKNPHLFLSDDLAGESIDITNPQYLIRESKILSNKLMQMGYKYYIVIRPESKVTTDDDIIRLLRRAQGRKFEMTRLVDEFRFTIMKYSNIHKVYIEADFPIQKISNQDVDEMLSNMNDFTALQQLGSLIHANDFNEIFKYISARHRDGSIENAHVFSALKYAIQIPYKTQVREVQNGNRQLINSDELRLHLRLGKVPIFRGTGSHWYRFEPA